MPFHDIIGHDRPKHILQAALRSGRLAHAYLFFGPQHTGKRLMAERLAQAVNCEQPPDDESDACGTCWACRQVVKEIHPDVMRIAPDGEQIKVSQIREMQDYIVLRPLIGQYKVYIIDDADRMNPSAANRLLKTLEEPPSQSMIIVVTSRPMHLLPTIRSRCQGIRFAPLSHPHTQTIIMQRQGYAADAAKLLAGFAQGRLGIALSADPNAIREERDRIIDRIGIHTCMQDGIASVFNAAEELAKTEMAVATLTWIAHWLRDVLILKTRPTAASRLMNHDRLADLTRASQRLATTHVLELLEETESMQQGLQRNLNAQLQLEVLFIRMLHAFESGGRLKAEG